MNSNEMNTQSGAYPNITNEVTGLKKWVQETFGIRFNTIEADITEIKSNATVNARIQNEIARLYKSRIVDVLGGKKSYAYKNKSMSQKTFMAFHSEYKRCFNVGHYRDTRPSDVERATRFIENWLPSNELRMEIEDANNQISLESIV